MVPETNHDILSRASVLDISVTDSRESDLAQISSLDHSPILPCLHQRTVQADGALEAQMFTSCAIIPVPGNSLQPSSLHAQSSYGLTDQYHTLRLAETV